MKILINIILFFFIASFVIQASIKVYGFVENGQNCDFVINAKITLDDSLFTFTDARGYFKFNNIGLGNHIIKVEKEKFITKTDTIKIIKSTIDYRYVPGLIPKPIDIKVPSFKTYHNYFKNKSPENILEIKIDSSEFGSQGLELYSSIINKTDSTIYLIRDFILCRRINRYIWNSNGKLMKRNFTYIDFLPCETILGVTSADLKIIKPKEKVNYPAILFPLHQLRNYPKDIYKIKIEYEYSAKTKNYALSKLGVTSLSNYQELFFKVALVGKFMSNNEIFVDNSEIIKR